LLIGSSGLPKFSLAPRQDLAVSPLAFGLSEKINLITKLHPLKIEGGFTIAGKTVSVRTSRLTAAGYYPERFIS